MHEIPLREQRIARCILITLLLAISLPYLFAALITPSNLAWSGLLFSVDDQNVHLSWARQVQDGAFFLRDLFTTEPLTTGQRPLFFNLYPLLMGWLAKLTTLNVVIIYHIVRVAAAGVALWQFHLLTLAVTRYEDRYSRARIIALFLLAFTAGAGFLGTIWTNYAQYFDLIDRPEGDFPLMPEAFFSLSAFILPVNMISMGLLAFLYRKVLEKKGALPVFIAALVLSNIHTYDALPLVVIVFLWSVWGHYRGDKARFKVGAALIAGAILPVIYQVIVFRNSEEFRLKAITLTLPPPLIHLALSLSPLLIFLPWTRRALRELPGARLMFLWVVVTFTMIYAPASLFPFARKMIEGIHLPLCILAALGASVLLDRIASSKKRQWIAGAVLLSLTLSPLQCLWWIKNNFEENNSSRWKYAMPPVSVTQGEAGALRTLNAQQGDGAVLCLIFLGSFVPRAANKPVYMGHWAETLYFGKKLNTGLRFYRGEMSLEEARAFLQSNHIRWVVQGPFERNMGHDRMPWRELGLRPIYTGGDAETGMTTVYVVP